MRGGDLDSFAAFLTQPDTVEFAHDGITIDSRAPFTRESWLFTHQITSYGAWTFLPLALRLTMHSARFELTLALKQEVPKPSCFQVTPDLFHWQGHLLDGVRVTLSFGIGCLELASDTFVYVRFPFFFFLLYAAWVRSRAERLLRRILLTMPVLPRY